MDGRQNSIPELELVAMGLIPELVPLEAIDPNPWQVRGEDTAHVSDLARDIAESGLLQPGMGRRVGERVQLAFGHSRLAAYRYLNELSGPGPGGEPGTEFAWFPVVIRPLDDQQMAEFAIAENIQRRDLSAIEKARALQRYCKDFGRSQAEAGERFGLGQSAVSHLMRLLELPEGVQDLVNDGDLPERFARQLVSLARVAPQAVIHAAAIIAKTEPEDREEIADQELDGLLDEHGRDLEPRGGCYWDPDWRPSDGAVTCKFCPSRVTMRGQQSCTDVACFEARQAAWQQHELDRISDKFAIPMAQAGEGKPLQIDYRNLDLVKGILKRKIKPNDLRVMALPEGASGASYGWHYHADALGSQVVVLGSLDTLILDREQRAKEAKAAGQDAAAVDDPKAQAEAEESEREERREQRAAVRRAQHDIPWLIFHTAEVCGEQLQVAGAALEWMRDLVVGDVHEPGASWAQYNEFGKALDAAIEDKAQATDREILMRRDILALRFTDEIWQAYDPLKSYDWPRALESIEEQASQLELRLPKGWDTPPVQHTKTNCHVCGRFTSMDHVTLRDEGEGWQIEGKTVTCSDECRTKVVQQPAMAATAKKAKSQAVKRSQAKGKRK